jgi:UDP-glucose:(heptosyl)LPS alpha-1,3-glucosyltransferase
VRIALIIERMNPALGGRERSTAQIADELLARGHEVTVVCAEGETWPGGPAVEPLGGSSNGSNGGSMPLRRFVEATRAWIERNRPDVSHAMLPVPGVEVYQPRGGTVPGQIAASRRRRGVAYLLVSPLLERFRRGRRLAGRLEARTVADPRCRCLAVSAMVAEEFARHYPRCVDRARVVLNGVAPVAQSADRLAEDSSRLREAMGVDDQTPVYVTIARNPVLKGVPELLGAWRRWGRQGGRRGGARLIVVGGRGKALAGSADPARWERRGDVWHTGPVEDIVTLQAACDVNVLLSWYDACSRTVLEATRMGVPSLTTLCNGAAEVLVRHGCGEVVDTPADADAVVRALGRLADSRHRRRLERGCRRAACEITMERHVDQLIDVYREVADR